MTIALGIAWGGLAVVCIAACSGLYRTSQGQRALASALLHFSERSPDQVSTDPALTERLETVERRVELALDDLNKQYRKLAQERRRLGQSLGEEVSPEDLELADALSEAARPSSQPPTPPQRGGRLRRVR